MSASRNECVKGLGRVCFYVCMCTIIYYEISTLDSKVIDFYIKHILRFIHKVIKRCVLYTFYINDFFLFVSKAVTYIYIKYLDFQVFWH